MKKVAPRKDLTDRFFLSRRSIWSKNDTVMSRISFTQILVAAVLLFGVSARLEAGGSKSVTMTVGETQTFYLPSSITSLRLKSCYFYAASPAYADVKSYTSYSVTIVAKKPTPGAAVVVRCDYTYYAGYSGYTYGGSGYYDYLITVVGKDPTSITLPQEKTVYVGEGEYLKPTITPSDAYVELTWSSSVYSTINVDKDGRVLAQRPGTSVITVKTQNGLSASCTVTAIRRPVDPTSITLSPNELTLVVGGTATLTATVKPADATDKTVTWSSLNPDVVSVTSGEVKALKEGTTIIYAKTVNNLSASCQVRVILPTLKIPGTSEIPNVPALANLDYSRTFLKGWNSICVPFGFTTGELEKASGLTGCRIATLKEVKSTSFLFENVDAVEGGTPCLVFFPEEATVSIKKERVTMATAPKQTSLVFGTYRTKVIGPGYYKLNTDGTAFGLTTGDDAYVKASRIYIKKDN